MICVDIVIEVIHVGVSPITLYALHVMCLLIMYIQVIYIQITYFCVRIAKNFFRLSPAMPREMHLHLIYIIEICNHCVVCIRVGISPLSLQLMQMYVANIHVLCNIVISSHFDVCTSWHFWYNSLSNDVCILYTCNHIHVTCTYERERERER